MAGRGTTTFEKRQKEQNRKEKRQDKLARRLQRKQETVDRPAGSETEATEGIEPTTDAPSAESPAAESV
jgi:hypothetical protein